MSVVGLWLAQMAIAGNMHEVGQKAFFLNGTILILELRPSYIYIYTVMSAQMETNEIYLT